LADSILKIRNLSISLPKNADRDYAVEDVNLDVAKGEILCIVGESGSGKSVMTSAILNDVPETLNITSGSVEFDNQDILQLSQLQLNKLRGARISMIYQEPMAALNPST
jgi:peptide/nickel transport system ATP-binding protein